MSRNNNPAAGRRRRNAERRVDRDLAREFRRRAAESPTTTPRAEERPHPSDRQTPTNP